MLQSQRVSRSGLVYGSSLLSDGGADMDRDVPADLWYDMERFQMDHIAEVLSKLSENRLDDEIWGKVMVMERARRVAKAYLRKTTLIVDGSDEEFDGRTLGFNHFPNSARDDYTMEIKSKIGDGVIIKMDYQGNVKAMARGSTPIFVQGWKDTRNNCMSQRLVRMQGRLKTHLGGNEDEQVLKIFDMRRFKACLENSVMDLQKEAKHLLLKTCVRVALVKDGGGTDPMKTPCWFMIINLVALDMLVAKLPELTSARSLAALYGGADKIPRNQTCVLPPGSDIYSNPAALTQIIAAAVQQANSQVSKQIDVEQLAKLASSISVQQPQPQPTFQRKSRRCRTFSDSDDSPESSTDLRSRGRSVCTLSSATSSSGVSGFSSHRREKPRPTEKSLDAIYRIQEKKEEKKDPESKYGRGRPRLSEDVFVSPPVPKHQSATSDYDSHKEMDSSGSWSNSDLPRSYSSPSSENEPELSEPEPHHPVQPSVIQVNVSEDEENAVVITKTPHTPTCPTTRERTSTTSTTESRVPAPRPSQDPSESRTDIPVSRDTPTLRPAPTVPSTPGSAPKGASSIGRQLRQFWNSLRDRPTASKASWFGGLRRRPKCPLIPEQLYSPPNSNRCCANVDRQLPAVPPATTLRRFAPGPPSPLGPASVNGACRNPASPRLGRSRDDCGALPTRSPGRGLRRCNDADLYGSHHARPEEMLMY